jgi:hypothetical protein
VWFLSSAKIDVTWRSLLSCFQKPTVLLGSTNSSEESSSLKHTSSSNSAKVLQTKSINSSDSLKPLQSKPSHLLQTTGANQRTLKYLTSNNLTNKTNIKSSSLFKKTHSFKSTRDIINYFDKWHGHAVSEGRMWLLSTEKMTSLIRYFFY